MLHQIRAKSDSTTNTRGNHGSTGTLDTVVGYSRCHADCLLQRPEQNDISLAIVPRDHPLIPPPKLEPEASGLLDRLLDVFSEQPRYVHQYEYGYEI